MRVSVRVRPLGPRVARLRLEERPLMLMLMLSLILILSLSATMRMRRARTAVGGHNHPNLVRRGLHRPRSRLNVQ